MGPVWEANHVWLIFVLVVCWTCYPGAFGSIVSTLAMPLFIAGDRDHLPRHRLRAARRRRDRRASSARVEVLFALSSILTPFALAAVIGGIASGRVPVGNARGDLVTSWLNPTSRCSGCSRWPPPRTWPPSTSPPTPRVPATPSWSAISACGRSCGVVAGAVALAGLPSFAATRGRSGTG